ncbi:MAG: hypothetical protein ACE5G7_01865 [Candidatus Hydrothermarchaeaceae archaeon]
MDGLKISMELYLRCIETCPEDFWTEKDNGSVFIHCRRLESEHCRRLLVGKSNIVRPKTH